MKFELLFLLGLTILTTNSFGQRTDSLVVGEEINFEEPAVVIPPSFPGGQTALTEYLHKNFTWKQGQHTVQGRVFVVFLVDVDGKIKDATVIRGLCDSCDKEALRLVKNMPAWIPGTENGKPIEARAVVPVEFRQ